jgi:hypothetical protein
MRIGILLQALKSDCRKRSFSRPAARRRSFVPRLEILENRTVPSGYQQINLVSEVPGSY